MIFSVLTCVLLVTFSQCHAEPDFEPYSSALYNPVRDPAPRKPDCLDCREQDDGDSRRFDVKKFVRKLVDIFKKKPKTTTERPDTDDETSGKKSTTKGLPGKSTTVSDKKSKMGSRGLRAGSELVTKPSMATTMSTVPKKKDKPVKSNEIPAEKLQKSVTKVLKALANLLVDTLVGKIMNVGPKMRTERFMPQPFRRMGNKGFIPHPPRPIKTRYEGSDHANCNHDRDTPVARRRNPRFFNPMDAYFGDDESTENTEDSHKSRKFFKDLAEDMDKLFGAEEFASDEDKSDEDESGESKDKKNKKDDKNKKDEKDKEE